MVVENRKLKSQFSHKGKFFQGKFPYMRAGIIMDISHNVDDNGFYTEVWDQSEYDHVVINNGKDSHYAHCPECDGELIFKDGRYRCLDCETVFSKKILEVELKGRVEHIIEDDYFEYDPDDPYNEWADQYEFLKNDTITGCHRRKI